MSVVPEGRDAGMLSLPSDDVAYFSANAARPGLSIMGSGVEEACVSIDGRAGLWLVRPAATETVVVHQRKTCGMRLSNLHARYKGSTLK